MILQNRTEEPYLAKQNVYWKGSSWNVEYWYIPKKRSKFVWVHGCRGNNEFQICASRHNLMGNKSVLMMEKKQVYEIICLFTR